VNFSIAVFSPLKLSRLLDTVVKQVDTGDGNIFPRPSNSGIFFPLNQPQRRQIKPDGPSIA
jgi:hypothetical protein